MVEWLGSLARRAWLWVALALLLGVVPSAHARQHAKRLVEGPLTVEWELIAASARQGYAVALVRVEVDREFGEMPVDLRFLAGFRQPSVVAQWRGTATFREPAQVRLLVPMFAFAGMNVRAHLRTPVLDHPGLDFPVPVSMSGGSGGFSDRTIGLFHVSSSAAQASQLLALSEALSEQPLPDLEPFRAASPFRNAYPSRWHGEEDESSESEVTMHFGGTSFVIPTGAAASSGGPGSVSNAYAIASLETQRLPRRAIELTSAGGVLVDADAPLPDGARLAVLLEYARLGGVLFFGGLSKADLVARAPVLAPLLEDRFRQVSFEGGEPDSNLADVYSLGLGRLIVGEERVLGSTGKPDDATSAALWWAFEREPNWLVDAGRNWAPYLPRTELQLAKVLPPALLAGICLMLGVVIGPVNYLVVWKRRRPALLLVTVPALSVALALLIGVIGIVRLGFDIQTTGASLAVLDQRSGDLAVGEARGFFAGFTMESGLAPEPGSVVLANLDWGGFRAAPNFSVERDGALLSGDVLPSRKRASSSVLSARRTRQRLDVEFAGGGPKVTNGFEGSIEELVLRAPDGALFRAPGQLAPGASASLVPTDEIELARVLDQMQPGPDFLLTSGLVPASYAARLGAPCLAADLGVPLVWENAEPMQHGVIGILEVGP